MIIGMADVVVAGCSWRYSCEKLLRDNFMSSRVTARAARQDSPFRRHSQPPAIGKGNYGIHLASAKRL